MPEELQKRPIALKRIPSVIEGILAIESELTFESLDAEARKALSRYLGQKITSPWDISFSQLGGLLVLVQGHWDIKCPNKKCATKREFRKLDLKMQELAVVEQDAVCGFDWVYAPLAFHICRICGTIQGNFRCS